MPDDPEQQELLSRLELMLQVSGVPDAQAAFREIVKTEEVLIANTSALKAQYGGLDNAVKALIERYKERNKEAVSGLKKEAVQVAKATAAWGGLTSAIHEGERALKSLVVPSSFGDAIRYTLEYNRNLLELNANVNRLGTGLSYLEKSLIQVANEINLTREQTVELFNQFQQSMKFISLQQFEDMLKRARSIVGANSQAIGRMQNAIANLSQEYPRLALSLSNIAKLSSDINGTEKESIRNRVRNLYYIGKIGDAQYKQIMAYISGAQIISASDRKRQIEMQRQVQLQQEFRQQVERVKLAWGQALLPFLEKGADVLQKIVDLTGDWKKVALTTLGLYAGFKIGGSLLRIVKGGISGVLADRMGGILGGGVVGKTGISPKGGFLGGVVGSIEGQRVHVTNFRELAGYFGIGRLIGGTAATTAGATSASAFTGAGAAATGAGVAGAGRLSRFGRIFKTSAGKAGGLGIVLGLGSMGLEYGAKKLEERGEEKYAGAARLGAGATGIGAGVLTGAAIGSIIPGIGTAIGAGIGGVVGSIEGQRVHVTNFRELAGYFGIGRLIGGTAATTAGATSASAFTGAGAAATGAGVAGAGRLSRFGRIFKTSAGKAGGLGIVLGLGSMGLEYGAKKLEERGEEKYAGWARLGAGASGIGAGVLTGAAIGSIIPGIGTAIGAGIGGVLGGLAGVISQQENIIIGYKQLTGEMREIVDKAKKPPGFMTELRSVMEERQQFKNLQREIEAEKEADLMKVQYGAEAIIDLYSSLMQQRENAEKNLIEAQEEVNRRVIDKFSVQFPEVKINIDQKESLGEAIQETIAIQEQELAEAKKILETKRGDYDKREIKEAEEYIKKLNERIQKMHEITIEEQESLESFKRQNDQVVKLSARLENLTGIMSKAKDVASALAGLFSSHTEYVDTLIERMSILGEIDLAAGFNAIRIGLSYLDAQVEAERNLITLLEGKESIRVRDILLNRKISEQAQEQFQQMLNNNKEQLSTIDILQAIESATARINSLEAKRTESLFKISDIYKDQLSYIQASANRASLLVQLADNYAIGVGASAEMRFAAYKAEGEHIKLLKERLNAEHLALAESERQGQINYRLRTKVRETENEILQAQIRQAQAVKSMRDAWVSAISAMNAGMDSFSEIVMNAEKNTAQIQRLDGAVRSASSGARVLRDTFGNIVEDVGFRASEVMNQFGEIVSKGGRKLWEAPYLTDVEKRLNMTREVGIKGTMEAAQRGEIASAVDLVMRQSQVPLSGALEMLGVTAHDFQKSVAAASTDFQKEITRGAKREIGELKVQRDAGKGGYGPPTFEYMGPGMVAIPTEPAEEDKTWKKALEDAPRGTLPRLIVNERRQAIPVSVVNLAEMEHHLKNISREQQEYAKPPSAHERVEVENIMRQPEEPDKMVKVMKIEGDISQLFQTKDKINISEALETSKLTESSRVFLTNMQKAGKEVLTKVEFENYIIDAKKDIIKLEKESIQAQENLLTTIRMDIARVEQTGSTAVLLRKKAAQLEENIAADRKRLFDILENQTQEIKDAGMKGILTERQRLDLQDKALDNTRKVVNETKRQAQEASKIDPVALAQIYSIDWAKIQGQVEEEITKDPLKIYYENITKKIIRRAKEVGLPPKEVVTYYEGFVREIIRTAQEVGLPPEEIVTIYRGFTNEIIRKADQSHLPPKVIPELVIDWTKEIYRIAELTKKPPETIEEEIIGYTRTLTRYAKEEDLSLKDLIIHYKGAFAAADKIVRDTKVEGLNTSDLLVAYSGDEATRDKIERLLVPASPVPKEAIVEYKDVINKFETELEYKNIPKEEIPVFISNLRNSIVQYADYPREVQARILGIMSDLVQVVSYENVDFYPEIMVELQGIRKTAVQDLEYKNILPEKMPVFFKGYERFQKRILEIDISQFDKLVSVLLKTDREISTVSVAIENALKEASAKIGITARQFAIDYSPVYDIIDKISSSAKISVDDVFDGLEKIVDIIQSVQIPSAQPGKTHEIQKILYEQTSNIFASVKEQILGLDNTEVQVIFRSLPHIVEMIAHSEPTKPVDLDTSKLPDQIRTVIEQVPEIKAILTNIADVVRIPIVEDNLDELETRAYYKGIDAIFDLPIKVIGEPGLAVLKFPKEIYEFLLQTRIVNKPESADLILEGIKNVYHAAVNVDVPESVKLEILDTPTIVLQNISKSYIDPKVETPAKEVKQVVDSMSNSLNIEGSQYKQAFTNSIIKLRTNLESMANSLGMSLQEMAMSYASIKGADPLREISGLGQSVRKGFEEIGFEEEKFNEFQKMVRESVGDIISTLYSQFEKGMPKDAFRVILGDEMQGMIFNATVVNENLPDELKIKAENVQEFIELKRGITVDTETIQSVMDSIQRSLSAPIEKMGMAKNKIDIWRSILLQTIDSVIKDIEEPDIDVIGRQSVFMIHFEEINSIIQKWLDDLRVEIGDEFNVQEINKSKLIEDILELQRKYNEYISTPGKIISDVTRPENLYFADPQIFFDKLAQIAPASVKEIQEAADAMNLDPSDIQKAFLDFYRKLNYFSDNTGDSVQKFLDKLIYFAEQSDKGFEEVSDSIPSRQFSIEANFKNTYDELQNFFDNLKITNQQFGFADWLRNFKNIYDSPKQIISNMDSFFADVDNITSFLSKLAESGVLSAQQVNMIQESINLPDFDYSQLSDAIDKVYLFGNALVKASDQVDQTGKTFQQIRESESAEEIIKKAELTHKESQRALKEAQENYNSQLSDTLNIITEQFKKYSFDQRNIVKRSQMTEMEIPEAPIQQVRAGEGQQRPILDREIFISHTPVITGENVTRIDIPPAQESEYVSSKFLEEQRSSLSNLRDTRSGLQQQISSLQQSLNTYWSILDQEARKRGSMPDEKRMYERGEQIEEEIKNLGMSKERQLRQLAVEGRGATETRMTLGGPISIPTGQLEILGEKEILAMKERISDLEDNILYQFYQQTVQLREDPSNEILRQNLLWTRHMLGLNVPGPETERLVQQKLGKGQEIAEEINRLHEQMAITINDRINAQKDIIEHVDSQIESLQESPEYQFYISSLHLQNAEEARNRLRILQSRLDDINREVGIHEERIKREEDKMKIEQEKLALQRLESQPVIPPSDQQVSFSAESETERQELIPPTKKPQKMKIKRPQAEMLYRKWEQDYRDRIEREKYFVQEARTQSKAFGGMGPIQEKTIEYARHRTQEILQRRKEDVSSLQEYARFAQEPTLKTIMLTGKGPEVIIRTIKEQRERAERRGEEFKWEDVRSIMEAWKVRGEKIGTEEVGATQSNILNYLEDFINRPFVVETPDINVQQQIQQQLTPQNQAVVSKEGAILFDRAANRSTSIITESPRWTAPPAGQMISLVLEGAVFTVQLQNLAGDIATIAAQINKSITPQIISYIQQNMKNLRNMTEEATRWRSPSASIGGSS